MRLGGLKLCVSGMLLGMLAVTTVFGEERSATQECVALDRIDVSDHEILTEKQQHKLLDKYLGRCIDEALLKSIVSDISEYYFHLGYITTRPYLEKQNIADGQLDVRVLKGVVEDIVDASTHETNGRIRSAFAFQKGKLLNLRNLETALEMVNRPPSSDARFEVKPGSKGGESIVEIINKDSTPFHLQMGLTGHQGAGKNDLDVTAEASLDNPFNINDILTIRYNGSQVQREYQGNRGGEVNYSFPVASYLFELVWSGFSYRQGVDGLNDTYLASGDTQGVRGRISKVLARNQHNKLSLAASVYHKNTKNYFASQLINVSSYKTTLAQLDVTHTWLQQWGRLTSVYSFYRGTDWFGARDDGYFTATAGATNQPKLQFTKHSLDLGLLWYPQSRSWQFSSNFHLQRSSDLLYNNDKLTVGSDYTVRGYYTQGLYGNNAWYIRNDVKKGWAINYDRLLLRDLSLFAGVDYGRVACEADNQGSCGSIAGIAAGFETVGEKLTTAATWSYPLKKISNNFKARSLVKLDMIWRF